MKIYPFGIVFALGKDYVFEVDCFRAVKLFSEPSINVEFECRLHHDDDHCPRISFIIIVLWMKLIEMSIYNVHHRNEDPVLVDGYEWCVGVN